MRLTRKRLVLIGVGTLAASLLGIGFVLWRAQKAIDSSSRELSAEQNLRVAVRQLPAGSPGRFEWVGSPVVLNEAAEFQGHLYLGGPSGLEQYDPHGNLEREYHVGLELPPSQIVYMATGVLADSREPELLLATSREGIVAFDGTRFRQIYPLNAEAREIRCILPLGSGRLLIGTEKRGVMVYDGKQITAFHPSLAKIHVTQLAGSESDLWVGTLGNGVLHWRAGQTDTFSEAQGLPDPQVLSLLIDGERALVGTPLGVALFEGGRLARALAKGVFAESLAIHGNTLLIGTMDQGIVRAPLDAVTLRGIGAPPNAGAQIGEIRQIFASEGSLYALTMGGLYLVEGQGTAWKRVLERERAALSDRNISALAAAPDGELWIGYFDRGLDILEPDAQRARHFEDEHIFCVNRIALGAKDGTVAVATANGLAIFDRAGTPRQVLGRADGLISDHVTDVTVDAGRMVVATPAGLTFLAPDGARSLYAFQGLVNNHVYALGLSGSRLLAGTLGGLSVLDRDQVVTSFTTANSGLRRNWIAAVVPLGHDWLIGTYGSGVFRLDDAGQFHAYDVATGDIDINPNAMLVTEQHVFAGSLGKGLFVYDRAADRWRAVREGLPSENVTALAAGNGFLYIGTDNGLVRIREKDVNP
jgi:hypothetical protein